MQLCPGVVSRTQKSNCLEMRLAQNISNVTIKFCDHRIRQGKFCAVRSANCNESVPRFPVVKGPLTGEGLPPAASAKAASIQSARGTRLTSHTSHPASRRVLEQAGHQPWGPESSAQNKGAFC